MIRKLLVLIAGILIALTASAPSYAAEPPKPAINGEVGYVYQAQPNFYWCGPAAVRIALSTAGHNASQYDLAVRLHTTQLGTQSAIETTRVMNEILGSWYRTEVIPHYPASAEQGNRLRDDVKRTVTSGHAVVANIAGTVTDTAGKTHSYPGGHYVDIVGYFEDGGMVVVADAAAPDTPRYELPTWELAQWVASRGYSTV